MAICLLCRIVSIGFDVTRVYYACVNIIRNVEWRISRVKPHTRNRENVALIEDKALVLAIREGLRTNRVSKKQIIDILRSPREQT